MTMKTVRSVSPSLPVAGLAGGTPSTPFGQVVKTAWAFAEGVYVRWRHREEIREMMELDDHLLCDMGITRYDVLRAGNAPLSRSAGEILSRSAGRRYSPPRRPIG